MVTQKRSPAEVLLILQKVRDGARVADVCRDHGISPSTLRRWRNEHESGRAAEAPTWRQVEDATRLPAADTHARADDRIAEPNYVTNENFPHTADRLFHIQIGVTYACQCRCKHCGVSQQRNLGSILTPAEIVDLCRQAKQDLDAKVVELFGGEPLVRKQIVEIVAGCAQYLDVWMSTNGIGFTRDLAERLRDAGLRRCFFSLDSVVPEQHDANRNRPGAFAAVMQALDYCAELGIDANLSTCAMANLVISDELQQLIDFTRQSKAQKLRLVLPKMIGRLQGNESILLKAGEIERVRQITAEQRVAYVEAEGNYDGRVEKCFCLRGHVYVNPYGVVQPCVYTLMNYGNVREHPLAFLYQRMFEHHVFKDKSILNLCLLQNPDFVKAHLSGLSDDQPIVDVDFD